jgi:hypothetical protein
LAVPVALLSSVRNINIFACVRTTIVILALLRFVVYIPTIVLAALWPEGISVLPSDLQHSKEATTS